MESRSTKTSREICTINGKTVTKTITEVTITKPDGSTKTEVTESITEGEPGDLSNVSKMAIGDKPQSKKPSKAERPPCNYTPSKDLESFINEAVDRHNELRKKHKAESLVHAKDLSEYAQEWADHMAKTKKFGHSKCTLHDERLGENVAYQMTSDGKLFSGKQVVDMWYKEIDNPGHDFSKDHQPGTGHFTQVVWQGTKEVGMGMAKASDGSVFAVGSYRPAGNMLGSFKENVFAPQ